MIQTLSSIFFQMGGEKPPNRSVFDTPSFFKGRFFCCCWTQFAFLRQLGQSQGDPDCHMAFLVLKYSLLYIEECKREPRRTPKCGWESTFSPTSTLSPIVLKSVELAFLSTALALFFISSWMSFISFDPGCVTFVPTLNGDVSQVLRHPRRLWCSLQFYGPVIAVCGEQVILKSFGFGIVTKDESAV